MLAADRVGRMVMREKQRAAVLFTFDPLQSSPQKCELRLTNRRIRNYAGILQCIAVKYQRSHIRRVIRTLTIAPAFGTYTN